MYIGLDVGTSGCKSVVTDRNGRILRSHTQAYALLADEEGRRELDAECVFRAVKACILAVSIGYEDSIRAIAVSSLGESVIPVDVSGKPLMPGILGTDIRGRQETQELLDRFGGQRISEITGQNVSFIYSLPTWMWLERHEPAICEKTWKFFTYQGYVLYCLCGEAVMDTTMATRTLAYDLERQDWSAELLSAAGVPKEQMLNVVPSGTVVGTLKTSLARELGLSGAPSIVVGSHDHICSALGSGVCQVGDCAVPCGTTEGFTAVMPSGSLKAKLIADCQISRQPFVCAGLDNTVAWQNTAGALYRWYSGLVCGAACAETYQTLAAEMPAKPTRLMVLPHFSGAATPDNDSLSKGAIMGLGLETTRGELYRALMEGVAYEDARILGCLRQASVNVRRIVCTGGAATDFNLQLKADVLRMEVDKIEGDYTGALGNALLACVADGCFPSAQIAAQCAVGEVKRFSPCSQDVYASRRELYQGLYQQLKPIHHAIAGFES